MARFLHHDFPAWWRKGYPVLLAFGFMLGLFAGCLIFFSAESESASWMRAAADSRVSIVGLLSVILLPFLFSAFAVFIGQPWLLLPMAFCKAVSFSMVSLGLMVSFGSAGWLMRILLMFPDLLTLPLLFFFWLRCASGEGLKVWSCLGCLMVALAIGSMDFYIISPFLAGL